MQAHRAGQWQAWNTRPAIHVLCMLLRTCIATTPRQSLYCIPGYNGINWSSQIHFSSLTLHYGLGHSSQFPWRGIISSKWALKEKLCVLELDILAQGGAVAPVEKQGW